MESAKKSQKSLKHPILEGLGLHLGRVWAGLGPLLGILGRLLAVLGASESELFYIIGPRWSPRGLPNGFWVDLARVWGGFGRVGRGFWKDLAPRF